MSGCGCKKQNQKRALKIVYGRQWNDLNDIEQGQLGGLYETEFGKVGTDEQIKSWLGL